MSEYRFTDGNLIILYAVHSEKELEKDLPDFIIERVNLGINTYNIIMSSKPDRHRTGIIIVGSKRVSEKVKSLLLQAGIEERIIAIDSDSENLAQTFDNVVESIKKRPNPPFIYFIGSVWLRGIYDSTVISKLKGYRIQFEGALDHRPVGEVETEKALDAPKRGIEYYKRRTKNRAVDMLLNYIFPEEKK